MDFKPMLASQIDDLSSVKYPVYASYKLDGIHAIIYQGGYDVPRFPVFKGIRNEIDFKE